MVATSGGGIEAGEALVHMHIPSADYRPDKMNLGRPKAGCCFFLFSPFALSQPRKIRFSWPRPAGWRNALRGWFLCFLQKGLLSWARSYQRKPTKPRGNFQRMFLFHGPRPSSAPLCLAGPQSRRFPHTEVRQKSGRGQTKCWPLGSNGCAARQGCGARAIRTECPPPSSALPCTSKRGQSAMSAALHA